MNTSHDIHTCDVVDALLAVLHALDVVLERGHLVAFRGLGTVRGVLVDAELEVLGGGLHTWMLRGDRHVKTKGKRYRIETRPTMRAATYQPRHEGFTWPSIVSRYTQKRYSTMEWRL